MSFSHQARASSAFPNFRQAVAPRHQRRHTTSGSPRIPLRDRPASRQGCSLKAFNGDSEGHPSRLPEVQLQDPVDVFEYQHKDDPLGQEQTGTIAQNLLKELPDTVVRDPASGLLSVKLDKLLAYTLENVHEAGRALKKLDAKQSLGLSILMHPMMINSQPACAPHKTATKAWHQRIQPLTCVQTLMMSYHCQPVTLAAVCRLMHPQTWSLAH